MGDKLAHSRDVFIGSKFHRQNEQNDARFIVKNDQSLRDF